MNPKQTFAVWQRLHGTPGWSRRCMAHGLTLAEARAELRAMDARLRLECYIEPEG